MDRGRTRGEIATQSVLILTVFQGKVSREKDQTNAQNLRIYEILPNEGPF